MLALFKYSAAITSARVGIGQLLSEEDWDNLLSAQNAEQIYAQLKNTAYQDVFQQEPFNLETTESQIQTYFAKNARIPFSFLSGPALKVVEWYVKRLDLENLITLIRGITHRVSFEQRRNTLLGLENFSDINWMKWAEMNSIDTLIGRLESIPDGNYYAKTLRDALTEYRRQQRTFILEIALYKAYFRRLRSYMNQLMSDDKKHADTFLGYLIDYTNLLWAYRYHVFFKLEPELIHAYTLTSGKKVNSAVIKRITNDAPMPDVLTAVWGTQISDWKWLRDTAPRKAITRLEILFRRHLYTLARHEIGTFKFHYGVILAYLILLENEGRDLITLMEGVHNGWSVENIRKCMITGRVHT